MFNEFKYADVPRITRSMETSRGDLKLERTFVLVPGDRSYPLNDWAEVLCLADLRGRLERILEG